MLFVEGVRRRRPVVVLRGKVAIRKLTRSVDSAICIIDAPATNVPRQAMFKQLLPANAIRIDDNVGSVCCNNSPFIDSTAISLEELFIATP